jgi:acyl-CoA dehydrogenase
MIDFRFSERDQKGIESLKDEGLICRKYARYYDEHEEELPPNQLPEAKDFARRPRGEKIAPSEADSGPVVMAMVQTIYRCWGDYAVKLNQPPFGGLGNAALQAAGTEDQKQRWGDRFLSMAITEPGCGSDPSRLTASAVLDTATNEWILNGEKIFVTGGVRADGVVVWATVDKSAGRAGIKSFLVLKGTPGFDVAKKEKKLGIRGEDTATYVFTDCRIPRDHLLGGNEEVQKQGSGGFRGVMKTFNMTRPAVAAFGIGIAEAALDFTRDELEKAGVDLDYGASIGSRSAVAEKFLKLEALHEASKLTVFRAAWLAEQGQPNNLESSVCKSHAGTAVRQITQGCIDILGPLGISRDNLLEKWARDCRIIDIYEGTGQIQRLIIARDLFGYTRNELN